MRDMGTSLLQSDSDNDAERLFINSIKSKETKRVYLIHLQKYLAFVHCKSINDLIIEFKETKEH